jgi:sugar phosphate isomerase/epimerase
MKRELTLFTGQWADLELDEVASLASSWGYDGLEIACVPRHFDVQRAVRDDAYLADRHDVLRRHGLSVSAVSQHLVGQAVCDPVDLRHRRIVPDHVWGDGDPEGVRVRAAEEMKSTAIAAARFGVSTVTGFTGSSIWHLVAMFPPALDGWIDAGYDDFATRWLPILDVFMEHGVRFALEPHPGEIAYDYWTTKRALDAVGWHPAFGLNFDPSHLHWQRIDPVGYLSDFAERIFHVDCKDTVTRLDGRNGQLGSHLPWGDLHRGWDFTTPGRGHINWSDIFRAIDAIKYVGPVSIEWEDALVARETGAAQALEYLRQFNVDSAPQPFDAAFGAS